MVEPKDIYWAFWQCCNACKISDNHTLLLRDSVNGTIEFFNVQVELYESNGNRVRRTNAPAQSKQYTFPLLEVYARNKQQVLAEVVNKFITEHPEIKVWEQLAV